MQSPEFFEKLDRSLEEQEVAARAVELAARARRRLADEFQDHYRCGLQERLERGMGPLEAEREAVAALGDPGYLAEAAANKWRASLWANRHPLLFGLAGGFGAYLVAVLFVLLAAYTAFHIKKEGWLSPGAPLINIIVFLCMLSNWLPALVGGLWMGWGYGTKRFHSRTFWIGCVGVALGASLFCVDVVLPTAADHHGNLTVNTGPLVSSLYWLVAVLTHREEALGGTSWVAFLGSAMTWLQAALTFVFAWVIYGIKHAASHRRERNT